MLVGASGGDPVQYALTLDRVAKDVGVNFIGGFSALVHKGFSPGDRELIEAIPRALSSTDLYVLPSILDQASPVSIWMRLKQWEGCPESCGADG